MATDYTPSMKLSLVDLITLHTLLLFHIEAEEAKGANTTRDRDLLGRIRAEIERREEFRRLKARPEEAAE
ncbi:MAG TPA: hypothetical protein VG758_18600 [Hyphomicrobiaceae bacterium]|jgi:hypothetical protein|nr:hypothetical protein [Hyphomicrobiaceae bacterium]